MYNLARKGEILSYMNRNNEAETAFNEAFHVQDAFSVADNSTWFIMYGTFNIHAGSIISFIISYATGSADKLQEQKVAEQIDGSILNGLKILLADDNEYNRIVARDTLQSDANMEITDDINGKEVISLLDKNDFDVILMDVQMPVMDGFATTRCIREYYPAPKNTIPIIALTANVIRSDLDKCRQAGKNDYVPKPFKTAQLVSAIAHATGREVKYRKKVNKSESINTVQKKAIFDLQYLEEFCAGNKAMMQKYINMFIDSVPIFTDKINSALYEIILLKFLT